jgi:hypothetical protein
MFKLSQNEMKGYIQEPLKQYELFSKTYLRPFGVELSSNYHTKYSTLAKESDSMMTQLQKKVSILAVIMILPNFIDF